MQQTLLTNVSIPLAPIRARLQAFDFVGLFNELGWDYLSTELPVAVKDRSYLCRGIAQKRGFQVFLCHIATGESFPDRAMRIQIDRAITRLAREHLLVFVDAAQTTQIWHWTERQPGQPLRPHEQEFRRGQSGEGLAQRLGGLFVAIEEDDESLTVLDISGRVRSNLAAERVTNRFYDRFKQEHAVFRDFVSGIQALGDRDWYASLMLNRLMFVYFIQKQGFLNSDLHYLRHKLGEVRTSQGEGQFLSFYRHFLRRLFHEGLSLQAQERPHGLDRLLGNVPYLNGGLFDVHDLEAKYPAIDIPDEAFDRLFDFFDAYRWHLDELSSQQDDEINPDVLGYIFEKYINQKQMGAYYTKEDITEYIGKNTIIPAILDRAKEGWAVAFRPDGALWNLLSDDPDRYIYPAVRKGTDLPLPPEIAAGLDDVTQRGEWNRPAAADFALPTETWREHIARRKRYEEIWEKLVAGEVTTADQLITLNLDLRQFAQDAIAGCEDPETLWAFWKAIESLSVLDPTCGSGAFLFAALNILQPLADECLDRMQAFVDELDRSDQPHRPERFADFRKVLAQVESHPNREYFVLKQIVLNNLYGVDIMAEAVEICKLRLFLKLVAQLEEVRQIEPLPDIDFNIRTGNTLVGFVSLDEVDRALSTGKAGQLMMIDAATSAELARMKEEAEKAAMASARFRDLQDEDTASAEQRAAKQEVRKRLATLSAELDGLQARVYGIDPSGEAFDDWQDSHRPFHWLTEFYEIVQGRGGFDVIIGNPPYVEYAKIRNIYTVRDYATLDSGNLYSYVFERSSRLARQGGRVGLIVPLGGFATARMESYRSMLASRFDRINISNYSGDANPSVMFDGVKYRLSIVLGQKTDGEEPSVQVSKYMRWYAEERPGLFGRITYTNCPFTEKHLRFCRLENDVATSVLQKILDKKGTISQYIAKNGTHLVHYHRSPVFWIRAMDFEPYFNSVTRDRSEDHLRDLVFRNQFEGEAIGALLNSTTFYFWFIAQGNCRDLANPDVLGFPIGVFDAGLSSELASINAILMSDLRSKARRRVYVYRTSGRVEYDEFYSRYSKPIIDGIDRVLAKHYGFTDEELDFIINYDIKYRMGRDAEQVEG